MSPGMGAVRNALLIWLLGLVTLVPLGTWYLFMRADRGQYALLIVGLLFWVFGYWAVAGPLLAALRVRAVLRMVLKARDPAAWREAVGSPAAREAAADLIARENRIPRFLAVRVVDLLAARLRAVQDGRPG
jgi:hypothetical protein